MADGNFTKQVVETLAKRAGNHCSNLDCGVLTCGPAESPDRSLTIGEAAHIFGARPGSARFNDKLSAAERGDITNAIWLCRNCHKVVDSDPVQFPADLLFALRRQHEENIAAQIGRPLETVRYRLKMKKLEEFSSCSYLAQQIIIDKPDHWEYKLTIELLRTRMDSIFGRWRSLERGLYVKASTHVSPKDVVDWHRIRFDEIIKLATAFAALVNDELSAAWGDPGTPGSETEILKACDLLVECAERVLQWEEAVRFALLPIEFSEVQTLLTGRGGNFLDQMIRIPREMAAIFNAENTSGEHRISLVLSLPDGWVEQFDMASQRAFYDVSFRST